ncbi:hypothetical protein [Chondromyces apiculatus]|uniref:Uncharacterized protein n=1 Tax=Chondromyces apiculatus DSM 436 TaxID=1192034 RepID=A0A017T1K1_9BACT|nr:hypothetical protein [Chondromyces apiculatus]EYF02877.1 Hypothetical protein CAP_6457 [Chondromyces apiculatus DSM 436]
MIIRRSGGELLHIGRKRHHGKASALAVLHQIAEASGSMEGLRALLAQDLSGARVGLMEDEAVIEALATRIAAGSLVLVFERPALPPAPPLQAAALPEPEPNPAPQPVEKHWIEIELRAEEAPHDPVPHARYVVELPNGEVVEGYLDENGKARLEGIPAGQCKVSFPDHAEPIEEGDVDLEEPEEEVAEPPPPLREECQVSQLVVACKHDRERKKKLTLPAPKGVKTPSKVIEVLGAWEGKGDTIQATLTGKHCSQHAGEVLVVTRPDGSTLAFTESKASFDAYYSASSVGGAFSLWPWDKKPVEFRLAPHACHGASVLPAVVRVYPAYEVSVSLGIALDAEKRSDKALAKAKQTGKVERRGRPAHTEWSFEFEGEIKYGQLSKKLGIEYESKLKSLSAVNLYVKKAIDTFCHIVSTYIGLDLVLELPNLSLAYTGGFKELDGSLRVGHEWSIEFEADPLFGAKLEADVLELLIKTLGKFPALAPIAAFLLKARAWAEAEGIEIKLLFALAGRIGFALEAKKSPADKRVQVGAKPLSVKVVASLTAKAKAATGVKWLMSFSAGAEIEGHTGVALGLGVESDDVGLKGKLDLTLLALELEFSMYASGKFEWSQSESKASAGGKYTFWKDTPLWEPGGYIMKYEDPVGGDA